MFKKIIISTIISSGVLLAQSSAGININEDDLEIEGVLDSRNLAALQTSSTIFQADVNFINIDSADQEATLLGAGIGATNKLEGVEGVELTFGAKFIWTSTKENFIDDSYTYLPLMAKIRYVFPPLMFNIPPISLEGKLLYAPGALAFGDSDKYSEFRASADIEMIENVKVYGGYRNIVAGFEGNTDYTFNNGWFAGLKFTYQDYPIKALFLDRDGIINVDHGYVYTIEKFEFTHNIFPLLHLFKNQGYLFFIVTNQSGIGRGYYSQKDFDLLTQWMLQRFKEEHIHIQSVHYCPHAPEAQCHCRKPQIGMIEQIVKAYPIELSKSWMIGDKQSDIDLAHNAKIKRTIAIGKRPIQGANYHFATIDDCKAYFENNPKSLD